MILSLIMLLSGSALSPVQGGAQVTLTPLPPPYLGLLTKNGERGIEVVEIVPGSPAERGGLKVGDLLLAVNDAVLLPDQPLGRQLGSLRLGVPATFTIRRGDAEQDLTIIPGERPTTIPPTGTPRPSATPDFSNVKPGGAYVGFGLIDALDGSGAQIEKVIDGSPAALVGLRRGDVITALDDQKMGSVGQVQAYLSGKAPGQVVRVTLLRDKQPLQFTITLGSVNPTPATLVPTSALLPAATGTPPANIPTGDGTVFVLRVQLGVTFEVVTEALARARNLSVNDGALVIEVQKGGIADNAGIRPGDVITEVEGDKVDAKRTLPLRMLPYVPGDTITLTVVRGADKIQVPVTLVARGAA